MAPKKTDQELTEQTVTIVALVAGVIIVILIVLTAAGTITW